MNINKSEKCCQMLESYGFGLLFSKVGCAEIYGCCFTKVFLISLPDLFARDFCILLMKFLHSSNANVPTEIKYSREMCFK